MTDPNHDTTRTAELDTRFSAPGATARPWADVLEVLERAEIFWLSTVRPDGRPHVTPLPAVWLDDRLHFATGPREQKAWNLARNPQCALTTGTDRAQTGLDVVTEGRAERVTDDDLLHRLADRWRTKLGWRTRSWCRVTLPTVMSLALSNSAAPGGTDAKDPPSGRASGSGTASR